MQPGGHRDSDAPLSRDEAFDEGRGDERRVAVSTQQHDYGYRSSYDYSGSNWGRRPAGYGYQRPRFPIETRPSFLTSEFVGTILAIVALGITAGVMNIVNARLTWILTAAMVVGYVVSRGLAKAGTESRAVDPRDELLSDGQNARPSQSRGSESETDEYQPAAARAQSRRGYRAAPHYPLETRPFFLTSEFVSTLLAIIAVACTAAAMPNLGARLTWILIAAMVAAYATSRGLAKAGTRSHSIDPRDQLLGDGHGNQHQPGSRTGQARGVSAVETKPFFVTSEFIGTLLAIVAIAISAATLDVLNVRTTWILITVMICGYVLSRGIAKIGVSSYTFDPREAMLNQVVHGRGREGARS